jgi:hypothetical protein
VQARVQQLNAQQAAAKVSARGAAALQGSNERGAERLQAELARTHADLALVRLLPEGIPLCDSFKYLTLSSRSPQDSHEQQSSILCVMNSISQQAGLPSWLHHLCVWGVASRACKLLALAAGN